MLSIGLLLTQSAAGLLNETNTSRESVPCVAAAEIFRDVVIPAARIGTKRSIVFRSTFSPRSAEPGIVGSRPSGLPSDLLATFEHQGAVSAIASCGEVREVLKKQQLRFGPHWVRWGSGVDMNRHRRAVIYAISLPVLSADGKQAVLAQDMDCGVRCGQSVFLHLNRTADGKWVVVREHSLGVS